MSRRKTNPPADSLEEPKTHHLLISADEILKETTPTRDSPLKEVDIKILLTLEHVYPLVMVGADLVAYVGGSNKTIVERLRILRERHLVHRPFGERGGEALTIWGLRLARDILRSLQRQAKKPGKLRKSKDLTDWVNTMFGRTR
jgi:hypothetical protein